MRPIRTPIVLHLLLAVPLAAQESRPALSQDQKPGSTWIRALRDRSRRGTLHNGYQKVRGDSGKWNDTDSLQLAPPIGKKPASLSLDDWADQLQDRSVQLTSSDDGWLLFRTRQLNDNDRVWVERVERRGSQLTVALNEAVWQGRYQKNFTGYHVIGVSLGKLEPGKYTAKWVVKPLVFTTFEGPGRPLDSWPKEERPAEKKPTELTVEFTVAPAPR